MKSSNLECSNLSVIHDNRFKIALKLFNSAQWYPAHDAFEELWHETSGPERITIHAILQISVAQLHLEKGNLNGATILYGEALGRLKRSGTPDLGIDLSQLLIYLQSILEKLQYRKDFNSIPNPFLYIKNNVEL